MMLCIASNNCAFCSETTNRAVSYTPWQLEEGEVFENRDESTSIFYFAKQAAQQVVERWLSQTAGAMYGTVGSPDSSSYCCGRMLITT